MDQHTLDTFAAQRLLCKLSDDRRLLMDPPLAAFRATGQLQPPMNYMTLPF